VGILLHEVDPREQDGRDAVARFKAQYRAAAFNCLSILKGEEVDAVFCDLHDDYVVRKKTGDQLRYEFFQVKTKSKKGFQWAVGDICGITRKKTQNSEEIRNSFVGKLVLHTIQFGDSCLTVNLQSNKDFSEGAYDVENAFLSANSEHKHAKHFYLMFKSIFPEAKDFNDSQIEKCLSKLRLIGASSVVDIEGADYFAITRQAIYDYTEIDLQFVEFKEIVLRLLTLVEEKSVGKIFEVSERSVDEKAGIFLDHVLSVMAISPEGYRHLASGGDPDALKHASMIQRLLEKGSATAEMIESLCRCKSEFDIWISDARHYISELDYQIFRQEIGCLVVDWLRVDGNVKRLLEMVRDYKNSLSNGFSDGLTDNACLGAFLAEIVRQKS